MPNTRVRAAAKGMPEAQYPSFVADRDGKTLPLAKAGLGRRGWWNVKPTGDYVADCKIGERLALEYLEHERRFGGPDLPLIVRDMPRELTGIEIGFLTTVSIAAAAGVRRAQQASRYWQQCEEKRQAEAA